MSETLANNITQTTQAPHGVEILLSDGFSSDGTTISDTYPVSQVVVMKSPNKIAYAKIVIGDGSVAEQDFTISNSDDFSPGRYVTIKMGDANGKPLLFKGVIVKHGIKIRKTRSSVLTIDCRDVAVQLTTNCKSRYFSDDGTDTDAFEEILGSYPDVSYKFAPIEGSHENMVQYNTTDWDFIVSRANAAGQLVYTNNGELTTVEPSVEDSEAHTLEYGDILEEFEAEMDAKHQYSKVLMDIWDSSKQEVEEEETESTGAASLEKPGNISNSDLSEIFNSEGLKINYPGSLIAEDRANYLKAELIKSKLARIRGRASFTGPLIVEPRKTILLKGVGERFNGRTYITAARYEFSNGTWKTDVQFGLDRDWFSTQVMSSQTLVRNQIPTMTGLYIGVVTRLDDPTGEDRIKVRIPVINKEGEGTWAKMVRQDAGEHRGMFHLPELEDEVAVEFLNGDPRYPMVLGMMNSSMKPAPKEGLEEDNLKGYYSKIGSRLEFDDKSRTITLQTLDSGEESDLSAFRTGQPELEKNNTVFLDDENGEILIQDKNKNYIKLSKDSVHIYGDKEVIIESQTIEFKGQTAIKGEAPQVEFDGSATTTIKGGLVNIN